MHLFRTKSAAQRQQQKQVKSPIIASRNVEWNVPLSAEGHRDQPVTTRAQGHDRSRSQQLSHGEMILVKQNRRTSYHTDTTTRSIDPDARSVRIRSMDVVKSKPSLGYTNSFAYPTTPDGRLPTLKSANHRSPYVDEIADELDTRQLRDVLNTDSRRRRRRESAISSQKRLTNGSMSASRLLDAPPIPKIMSRQEHGKPAPIFKRLEDGTFEQLLTPDGTPVYDNFMETKSAQTTPQSRVSAFSPTMSNSITGASSDWHDADSIDLSPTKRQGTKDSSGIMLAGNRESFPDFAVIDSSKPYSNGVLEGRQTTVGLSSLWKRASAARYRKERDLAQHQFKALIPTSQHHGIPTEDVEVKNTQVRPMSGSSSVLYETLEDLPQQATIEVLNQNDIPTTSTPPIVPSDAFYDPTSSARPSSQQAQAHNFSKPKGSPLPAFPPQAVVQFPHRPMQSPTTKATETEPKVFPALGTGNVFPKPSFRPTPAQIAVSKAKAAAFPSLGSPVRIKSRPVDSEHSVPLAGSVSSPTSPQPQQGSPTAVLNAAPKSPEAYTGTPGFSSPAAAAGLQTPSTFPLVPRKSSFRSLTDTKSSPTKSIGQSRGIIPTTPAMAVFASPKLVASQDPSSSQENALPVKSELLPALMSHDEGAWFNGTVCAPVKSASQEPSIPGVSQTSDSFVSATDAVADGDERSTLNSEAKSNNLTKHTSHKSLGDEVDYDQGNWQTGIGKPVSVVASPLLSSSGSFRLSQVSNKLDGNSRSKPASPALNGAETPVHKVEASDELDNRGDEEFRAEDASHVSHHEDSGDSTPVGTPKLLQRPSFLTSTDTFYTANTRSIHSNSSNETLGHS